MNGKERRQDEGVKEEEARHRPPRVDPPERARIGNKLLTGQDSPDVRLGGTQLCNNGFTFPNSKFPWKAKYLPPKTGWALLDFL